MYTMKESVAPAKEADTKKEFLPTKSDISIHRAQNEPERQLGSLRSVIGNIRRNGGTPSVESIATELSSMHTAERASVLLALQRTHGNQYVQRVVAGIQAKLVVGQPGDIYEQEADRVADEVMRMPEPQVQRQVELEEEEVETLQSKPLAEQITPLVQRQEEEKEVEEEEEKLQTKKAPGPTPEDTPDLESRIQALKGGGQPLPESVRAFFEPRFGCDFNRARVHTDARAAEMVRAVNAQAFTIGRDVVFGAGQYAPETISGKKLLAHELTHVVQQNGGPTLFSKGKNSENTLLNSQELSIVSPELSEAPRLQAYYHQPVPAQPTSTDIYYSLSASTITLREILNSPTNEYQEAVPGEESQEEYQEALQSWPDDQQIWPHLRSRLARVRFIQSLLEFDRTNCRPYSPTSTGQERGCETFARNQETFQHFCLGFATQLHIRFRAQPEPPRADQIERLRSQASIYYDAIDPKFRIPILIAFSSHHAFNAILVGQDPSNIESYLFVEPQSDRLFAPSTPLFGEPMYFGLGMLRLSEFSEVGERGNPEENIRHCFIRDIFGHVVDADLTDEECSFVDDVIGAIFVADYPRPIYERWVRNRSHYESYARRHLDGVSDEHLVRVGAYFIGRHFRRSPDEPEELLDIDTFLRLAGRKSLRQRLKQSFLDLLQHQQQSIPEPPPPERTTPPSTELV